MNKPFVFAVCGYKNTGKTTLSVKLISALKAKGYRVASIKHDGHDFEADTRGTDSYRHREAGADQTIVFSENKMMMVCRPLSVETMIAMCADHDFILLEGFKKSSYPKFEIIRSFSEPSCVDPATRLAIVSDIEIENEKVVHLNDVDSLLQILLEAKEKWGN